MNLLDTFELISHIEKETGSKCIIYKNKQNNTLVISVRWIHSPNDIAYCHEYTLETLKNMGHASVLVENFCNCANDFYKVKNNVRTIR